MTLRTSTSKLRSGANSAQALSHNRTIAGYRASQRLTSTDGTIARFADGSSSKVSTVVWATGYRPDYSWIDVDGVLTDGRPRDDRGVTPAPGLYVLGLPWQHTRGSSLLGFVRDDAAHLAQHITEHIAE